MAGAGAKAGADLRCFRAGNGEAGCGTRNGWNCRAAVDCGPAVMGYIQRQRDAESRLEFIAGRPSLTAGLVISLSAGAFGNNINRSRSVAVHGLTLRLVARSP